MSAMLETPIGEAVQWYDNVSVAPQLLGTPVYPPIYRVGEGAWRLYTPFILRGTDYELRLPAEFEFNGSSIPTFVKPIIGIWDLSVLAPLGHDPIYQYRGVLPPEWVHPYRTFSRAYGDAEFRRWMVRESIEDWRRKAGFAGVRVGGALAFRKGVPYNER